MLTVILRSYSFLLRGGIWWVPGWVHLWTPDLSSDQVHQKHPDHRARFRLRLRVPGLPDSGDVVPIRHPFVSTLRQKQQISQC